VKKNFWANFALIIQIFVFIMAFNYDQQHFKFVLMLSKSAVRNQFFQFSSIIFNKIEILTLQISHTWYAENYSVIRITIEHSMKSDQHDWCDECCIITIIALFYLFQNNNNNNIIFFYQVAYIATNTNSTLGKWCLCQK
jgi:hypothetical protein